MFLPFFETLRRHGVPVSVREWLGFLEGLAAGLVTHDPEGFYYLARTILVKDERHLDRFDRAFADSFKGLEALTEAEVLEALCDGINDSLLAIVYEKRLRSPELQSPDAIQRQWAKVERGLDHLERHMPKFGKTLHGGHFALAAMLRYIELRFSGEWQRGRPKLKNWPKKFEKQFPDYGKFKA